MKRDKDFTKALGALDPLSIQVDERTLLDRLSFAAAYGELIAFYDKNNQKNGNWRPFFLKDPIILLAAISKTDYSSKHMLFILLTRKFAAVPDSNWTEGEQDSIATTQDEKSVQCNAFLEQLFNLIQSIFIDINDWITQMENDNKTYQLKEFVKKNVSLVLAPLLWQYLTLRRTASRNCERINTPDYPLFENFHPIWRTNINNSPAQVLPDAKLFNLTQQLYHPLFSFYVQVIDSAKESFNQLRKQISSPPDTALLIAFIQLMEVQQQQLNQMTKRHLDFYYRDILKQNNKPAHADETFVCLTLKNNIQDFVLPAGVEFNAGLDDQQQPLNYVSTQSQMLNQATLKRAVTLCYSTLAEPTGTQQSAKPAKRLHLNTIEKPAELRKNPLGQVQTWSLLGDGSGKVIKQGFAFASPMLSLQGGIRKLYITFDFTGEQELSDDYFDDCEAYLSTEKAWFKTSSQLSWLISNQFQLKITLKPSDPAITRFAENPEGISTQWPLFKLVLSDRIDLSKPPLLKSLTIANNVVQYRAFELYNDHGKLLDNNPFLPFGPIPAQGDNFYLGSAELFAKPLTRLKLHIHWDSLPESMEDYYRQYNEFLNKFDFKFQVGNLCKFLDCLKTRKKRALYTTINRIVGENHLLTTKMIDTAGTDILVARITKLYPNASDKLGEFLKVIAREMGDDNPLKNYQHPHFNNQSFKAVFSFWEKTDWQKVRVDNVIDDTTQAQGDNKTSENTDESDKDYWVSFFNTIQPKPVALTETPDAAKSKSYGLKFLSWKNTDSKNKLQPTTPPPPSLLDSRSLFKFQSSAFDKMSPDPTLLLQPLNFSGTKKSGFLKMKLQQPKYGFGNSLYAQVVMYVTAQNALSLAKALKNPSAPYKPISLPNPPYTPTIAESSVNYSARQSVDFVSKSTAAPFEFYHYDNFSCYQVYDSQAPVNRLVVNQSQLPGLQFETTPSIKLFAGIDASACLYLNLENIQPPCNLSLYFELAHLVALKDGDIPPKLKFDYLADNGWKPLKILADDTDSLSCSGILEVFITQDISQNNPLMPGSGYWLAITSNNPVTDFASVVYLNTQAIKVQRLIPQGLALAPQLDANKIDSLVQPLPQIDTISQPFPSFNGQAHEDDPTFYLRVSRRLKTKDRSWNQTDFESMALDALPGLYFCKFIPNPSKTGEVSLGLVNSYRDALLPDAYRPVVSRCDIDKIRQYFVGRISPFVQLKLFNLKHETVTVKAKLKFVATAQINRSRQEIERQLKIYLSPWIQSELPQITIDEGLSSAAIIDFLYRFPEVENVCSLDTSTELQEASNTFIIYPMQANSLFVSALSHKITVVSP